MFEEANAQVMLSRAVEIAEQAQTAVNTGSHGEGARLYVRAFEMAPGKAEYATGAAEQFIASHDYEQATHYAQQAMELNPKRTQPRLVLAQALMGNGDSAAAREQLEIAQTLDPADAHVKKALKRLGK